MDKEKKKEKSIIALKVINLVSGLLILGVSIWILLDSSAAIDFLVILIAVALVIIGIARIMFGTSHENLKKSSRIWKVGSGLIAIIVGLAINVIQIRFPAVSIAWIMLLSSVALLAIGLSRFFVGIQATNYPLWYRILIITAGCASIVISILIGLTNLNVVSIIANERTQVIIFAYTLILLALARISLIFLKKTELILEK